MPPRRTATTTARTQRPRSHATPPPEQLQDQPTSKHNLTKSRIKPKVETPETPQQRCLSAMRSINVASKTLSTFIDSGWKAGASNPATRHSRSPSMTSVNSIVEVVGTLRKDLQVLRELKPGDIDVERASSSIVGKLISLEMYVAAVDMLREMQQPMAGLYLPIHDTHSSTLQEALVFLPLPQDDPPSEVLLVLISAYLLHSLTSVACSFFPAHPHLQSFCDSLDSPGPQSPNLLAWLPYLKLLPQKHLDSVLTRAYTALTKSSSVPGANPTLAYRVRVYGLLCLAHTSPSVLEPTSFWEQAMKFTSTFVAGASTLRDDEARQEEEDTYKVILQTFEKLVENTRDRKEFITGKGFVKFCDYWMSFARKVGDIDTLERIAALGDSAPETTRLCALFTKATSALERTMAEVPTCNILSDEIRSSLRSVAVTLPKCRHVFNSQIDESEKGNLERAVERFRRVALKLYELGLDDELKASLESVIEVQEHRVRESGTLDVDLVSPVLDTLITIARKTLIVANPLTIDSAFEHLKRGESLLSPENRSLVEEGSLSQTRLQCNYTRVLSGAFYNLAGTLYQGGRYAHATRFFDRACILGSQCLTRYHYLRKEEGRSNEKAQDEDSWKSLAQQLYRRWEILGVCHLKDGDRKPAFDAFLQAIRTYPFFPCDRDSRMHPLTGLASSPLTLFSDSGPFKAISNVVDRITHIGTAELLLDPNEVTLKRHMENVQFGFDDEAEEMASKNLLIGALAERQILSLYSSLHKPLVREVVKTLLRDAVDAYNAANAPIRGAGVLILCLEVWYRGVEGVFEDVEVVGQETRELLDQEDLGNDKALGHLRPLLLTSLHLWLALHIHRNSAAYPDTQTFIKLIVGHSEQAYKIVKDILSSTSIPRPSLSGLPRPRASLVGANSMMKSPPRDFASGKSPKLPPAPRKKTAVRSRVVPPTRALTSSRSTRPSRTVAVVAPVTPKARRGVRGVPAKANIVTPQKPQPPSGQPIMNVGEMAKLVDLLRMTAQLLGLLGQVVTKVQILSVTRRLCERFRAQRPEDYVQVSVDLAHEYVLLGKTERAANIYGHALGTVNNANITDEVKILFYLRYSELLGATGNVSKSSSVYGEAQSLSETLDAEDKSASTLQRIKARVGILERAAMASSAFAVIQHSKDDPTTSLNGLLQSLRLWHRAVDTLARLIPPPPTTKTDTSNPFDMTGLRDALPTVQPSPIKDNLPSKTFPTRSTLDGLEWRVASGLLSTLFALTQGYYARGSAREAEYFAQQAFDFALSLNAPAMVGKALARLGEIQVKAGRIEDAGQTLVKAAQYVEGCAGVEKVELSRLGADVRLALQDEEGKRDGRVLYEEAMKMLEDLDDVFSAMDGVAVAGPRRSIGVSPKSPRISGKSEALIPPLLVAVLRQNISLLHGEGEEYRTLLDKLQSLPPTIETKAEENSLMAKLTLDDAYARFRADMFLNSLTESTITLPTGMTGERFSSSPTTQEILGTLNAAEKLFWSDLALVSRRGNVSHVRDAAISLALIRAFQTSLGRPGKEGPTLAARLLDSSSAITLRREMIDVIQHKFSHLSPHDDLQWPLITSSGSALPMRTAPKVKKLTGGLFNVRSLSPDLGSDEESEDEGKGERSIQSYWNFISEKYSNYLPSLSSFATPATELLPSNWTVISITLTEDKNTLFITRQAAKHDPLIFCVPLHGRRDTDDDDSDGAVGEGRLSFDAAVRELKEIVRLSDEGTRGASAASGGGREARVRWWADRAELDKRMKLLLEDIEFCWLGAFKTILNEPTNLSSEILTFFRTRLEKIFKRSFITPQEKKHQKTRVRLSDTLLECFSTLSPKSRDEELEDLVYFVLDLYQFHGVPVATSEVDITQVVIDLRNALEELHARINSPQPKASSRGRGASVRSRPKPAVVTEPANKDHHTFLILDKNVQGFPWESIPALRGRSVSRIPNLEFLVDRIQWARWQRGMKMETGQSEKGAGAEMKVDRVKVNPRNTYFILNPSGDLKNTEGRFAQWLNGMKSVGWDGIVGRAPSEQQMVDALTRNELLIYFGHGGAEQYIRSHKVRHLPRCAATMLWGCSSGALRDMGEFDRVGTPYNYMLAGCPTLVANLWDVTDRDIDKLSQAVFDKLRLTPDRVRERDSEEPSEAGAMGVSVVTAVAEARESCKLKYLTGAAPVVYGIPFYL